MPLVQTLTQEWIDKRNQQVARGVITAHPIFAARADGAKLWDVEGREYLDFTAGIGVMNVGHHQPHVVQAIQKQAERFTHTCFQVAMYDTYIALAEWLNTLVGGTKPYKTIFLTTGAEATENAIKIARAHTNRPAVIAFNGGFHGRTLLGTTLTASSSSYRQNFGPFAPEIYHTPFPYEYRGWTTDRALEALFNLFDTRVTPDRVAAMIVEPQLGEGGFVPAPTGFLKQLRRITEDHGIVLIADEIQTGFGRTGKMFAFEHYGIEPDLVTVAKSLAAGLPLSAVVGKAAIMDAPLPGGLGGTYAGNPLACAAGLAVLEIFHREGLVERGARVGQQLRDGLSELQRKHSEIGDVRGLGAMLAVELVHDRESKKPHPELAQQVVESARQHGLLLLKAGTYKNVVRFLPPLIVSEDEIRRALDILATAFAEAAA